MKRLFAVVLVSLAALTAFTGGCIDVKVDRDAVRVGRFLEPFEREQTADSSQLPPADDGEVAI